MRMFFLALVLLNLLALASIQGWLGTSAPRGEPERITNQISPERITLRPNGNAAHAATPEPAATDMSSEIAIAVTEPLACIAYVGLTEQQADALLSDADALAPELTTAHATTTTPTAWWVRIPPSGGREGAEQRVADLRALGITEFFIVPEAGPNQFAVSLGLFKSESSAQQHLAYLRSKRLRTASITTRTAVAHTVEIRGAIDALQELSKALVTKRPSAVKGKCTS
jgi:hypothetical protein